MFDSSNAIHVGLKIGKEHCGKIRYEPGDHVGVFATNKKTLVDGLVKRLSKSLPTQGPLQLQVLREQKGEIALQVHQLILLIAIFKTTKNEQRIDFFQLLLGC